MEESKIRPVPSRRAQSLNRQVNWAFPRPLLPPAGGNNDQVSFGSTFDPQIAIELAELEELLVVHLHHGRGADDQRELLDWLKNFCHTGQPSIISFPWQA